MKAVLPVAMLVAALLPVAILPVAMLIAAGLLAGCGPAETPVPATTASVVRIALPDEIDVPLPARVADRCTGCHSGEMIVNQPVLPADKWAATIRKMREVYHAPIAAAEDPVIVAALTTMQARSSPAAP